MITIIRGFCVNFQVNFYPETLNYTRALNKCHDLFIVEDCVCFLMKCEYDCVHVD